MCPSPSQPLTHLSLGGHSLFPLPKPLSPWCPGALKVRWSRSTRSRGAWSRGTRSRGAWSRGAWCNWVSEHRSVREPFQGVALQAAPTMSLCEAVAPYVASPLEGAAG